MRMWMIEPHLLCNRHLLGEHGEIHKFRKSFEKGISIRGRIHPVVQIEPLKMKMRHDSLAREMTARGMNHRSPYEQPDLSAYTETELGVTVDTDQSKEDLRLRCKDCCERL